MIPGWDEIESAPGFAGARQRAEQALRPVLAQVKTDPVDVARQKKIISRHMTVPFLLFAATFFVIETALPNGGAWELLAFLLFPALFILFMLAGVFTMRDRLAKLFVAAQVRLGQKAEAMQVLAAPLGLTYVPAPGGAPKGLEWLAKQSWAPAVLREAANTLNAAGGMDDAVRIVRESGLLMEANVHVIGSPEQKARYNEQIAGMRQIEDGFHGDRAGLHFELFEWIEKVDEAPDLVHLVIVLEAPFVLHGVTQLRARKTGWPGDPDGTPMQDVDLGPRAFDALYRLRSSDQVEARAIFNPAVIERTIALAHGGKFRAVARAQHLVFDFASEANRFQIVDLLTGAWSDETIRQTYADIAETLALVDALGHAFMLAAGSAKDNP